MKAANGEWRVEFVTLALPLLAIRHSPSPARLAVSCRCASAGRVAGAKRARSERDAIRPVLDRTTETSPGIAEVKRPGESVARSESVAHTGSARHGGYLNPL